MIKFTTVSAISLSIALFNVALSASRAEPRCGPDHEVLQVQLTSPFRCVTETLFKKQIDVQSDLNSPRAETAPDTDRRIKSLSEWRQGKPTKAKAPENIK